MRKKPVFTNTLQIGVVVNDVDAVVRRFADDYGIGPWKIFVFSPDSVDDMIVDGKAQNYSMRIAMGNIGGVQFELIQPLDDISDYARFLREHGKGLHHIAFADNGYDETMKFFQGRGHEVLQGGNWLGAGYTYLDTRKDLGFRAEIYNWDPNFQWPEPEHTYPAD